MHLSPLGRASAAICGFTGWRIAGDWLFTIARGYSPPGKKVRRLAVYHARHRRSLCAHARENCAVKPESNIDELQKLPSLALVAGPRWSSPP